jgi:hypothetical protein
MAKCRYYSCVRIASPNSDDCYACRARHRYWDSQTAAKRLERRRKLELSGETMREFVTDAKLKQGVQKGYKKEVRLNGS